MEAYILFAGLEKFGHVPLRQPDAIAGKPALNACLPIFRLIEQELAIRWLFGREIRVAHALASMIAASRLCRLAQPRR